ncbi:ATP-dependent RecD-like DNA helicase, partial [Staphylococcus warneri]
LYTGLTRAKQSLVFLGDPQAFDIGLKTHGQVRMTQLCTFLKAYFNNYAYTEEEISDTFDADIILTEDNIFKINPMINMGDIS